MIFNTPASIKNGPAYVSFKALLLTSFLTLLASNAVHAEDEGASTGSSGPKSAGNRPDNTFSLGDSLQEGPTGGIWQQSTLLGDIGGVRSTLGTAGISLNVTETSEVLGNITGGVKQSADYDGLTTATAQLDTQRAFGLRGGTFNVSALQVHGSNLSADNLDTLQTASGIEADRGFRLWELWYDQAFFYNKMDVKVGQQSIDQEFINSQGASLFVNTMFGWPMIPSADMLSGGPAYPLSSLGARIRIQPEGPFALLVGVYDDNPAGPCDQGDPQLCDNHGTNFRVNDDPLFIAELQFSYPSMNDMEYNGKGAPLPGTYKLGFWYDAGQFADQHVDTTGVSLATSATGNPLMHHGNYSIYTVVDQMLWRESPQSEESLGFFFRGMIAPSDRNLISMSLNAGLTYREPFEHRDDDVIGIGVGYADVSSSASSLDNDSGLPARTGETFIEATYQYAVAPWWQLQPDFQYVFNPGGGLLNPNDPTNTRKLGDEAVVGLRTNITF